MAFEMRDAEVDVSYDDDTLLALVHELEAEAGRPRRRDREPHRAADPLS